jgi:hypothetical protein
MPEPLVYQKQNSESSDDGSLDLDEAEPSSSEHMGQLEVEDPPQRRKKRRKPKPKFILRGSNILSQFFFYWIIKLVKISHDARFVVLT